MKKRKTTRKNRYNEEKMESKCPMCEKIHISTAKYKYCQTCKNSKKFKDYNKSEVSIMNDFTNLEHMED